MKVGQDVLFYDLCDILMVEKALRGRTRKQDPIVYDSLIAASKKLSAAYIQRLLGNGVHLQ